MRDGIHQRPQAVHAAAVPPCQPRTLCLYFFFFYRQVYQNFFEYDSIVGPHLLLSDSLMQFPQCKAIHFLGFKIAPTQSDFSVCGLCCLQPSQLQI